MRYAGEIMENLLSDLHITLPERTDASPTDTSNNFSVFGMAAGVFSATTLFTFLQQHGGVLTGLYKSGHFVAENWPAVQLAWETKNLLNISFLDAVSELHELHDVLDLADLGSVFEHLDLVDVAETLVDGILSFGVGYAAGKAVKYIGDKINKKELDEKERLELDLKKKHLFVEKLKQRVAPQALEALYLELPVEARVV